LERLQKEVRDEDSLFRDASNMLQGVRKTLEEITERATMDASEVEGRAQLNRLIKRKKLALDMAGSNLAFARKFIHEVSSEFESDLLEEYRIREAPEEQNVKECQDQLDEVLQERLQYDKSLTDAIKREKMLQAEIDSFIPKLEMKKKIVEQLKESSHRTLILRPSKSLVESLQEIQEPSFQWMPCALCHTPFPHRDIVLAPCMCLYHPWCVVMQNWISDSCAKEDCKKIFDETWQRSHGLFYMQGK
jgi:hypothetical protein